MTYNVWWDVKLYSILVRLHFANAGLQPVVCIVFHIVELLQTVSNFVSKKIYTLHLKQNSLCSTASVKHVFSRCPNCI